MRRANSWRRGCAVGSEPIRPTPELQRAKQTTITTKGIGQRAATGVAPAEKARYPRHRGQAQGFPLKGDA